MLKVHSIKFGLVVNMITRYEITAIMENGDKWITIRDTFKDMGCVVKDILKVKKVKKFVVEEKKC